MSGEDSYAQETGTDISSTGTLVTINKGGMSNLSVQIGNGDAAADYQVQVSQDQSTWYDTDISFSQVTSADGGGVVPERYARLQVTTAAGGGDTADVLLVAAP